jgi:hypothetical protein
MRSRRDGNKDSLQSPGKTIPVLTMGFEVCREPMATGPLKVLHGPPRALFNLRMDSKAVYPLRFGALTPQPTPERTDAKRIYLVDMTGIKRRRVEGLSTTTTKYPATFEVIWPPSRSATPLMRTLYMDTTVAPRPAAKVALVTGGSRGIGAAIAAWPIGADQQ